ncbi:MAG: hypothetical protein LUC93_12615 [Planctomycetaceae bacterium]|nr:hypothetical protein [Planctomycetaceae bacterium]
MGALTTVMNAASITMGAAQNYQNAQYQSAAAKLNADVLETQAARKELEAEEALAIGRLNQAEHVVEGRLDIASQTATYAASGVKVNEGSAVDVAADKAAWNEYGRQKLQYGAELESWGLRYDAALLRQEASNVRAGAGSGSNLAAVIGTGTKLAGLLETGD